MGMKRFPNTPLLILGSVFEFLVCNLASSSCPLFPPNASPLLQPSFYTPTAHTLLPSVLHAGCAIGEISVLLKWCTSEGFVQTAHDVDDLAARVDHPSGGRHYHLAQLSGLSFIASHTWSTCAQKAPIVVALASNSIIA